MVLQEALTLPPASAARLAGILCNSRGIVHEEGPTPRAAQVALPPGLGPLLPIHRKYLSRRGFDPDELERLWSIQGIGLVTHLAWRIFIPILYQGEVVSWTTRATTDDGMRYISARPDQERLDAHTLLFGEDYARHTIIVCEGCLDAIKIGPGAVATLGIKYTTAQVLRMSKYPRRVILFDNETMAQRRARKLAGDLSVFPGETLNCCLTSGKDAAEASHRDVEELRQRYLET